MAFKRFSLSNFKAFGPEAQSVPLKPITLVFGPNSAGKSSILHSLLWLRHGITQGDLDVHSTHGTRTDLGGFEQIIHGHQHGTRPVIGWSIAGNCIKDGVGGWNKFAGFDLELAFQRMSGQVRLIGFSVANTDGQLLRAGLKNDSSWRIDLLNTEHSAMIRLLEACGSTGPNDLQALDAAWIDGLYHIEIEDFLPKELIPTKAMDSWLTGTAIPDAFRLLFEAFRRECLPLLKGMIHIPPLRELPPRRFDPSRSDEIWKSLVSDRSVLSSVNRWLESNTKHQRGCRLEIIRFHRQDAVERDLTEIVHNAFVQLITSRGFSNEVDSIMDGVYERWNETDRLHYLDKCPDFRAKIIGNEIERLRDLKEPETTDWTDDDYSRRAEQTAEDIVASEPFYFFDSASEPHFIEFLKDDPHFQTFLSEHWDAEQNEQSFQKSFSTTQTEQRTELMLRELRGGTMLSLQDVGVGISQLLPVLVTAYARHGNLIAIEQPEIHIHPALQAELGDVFIESALGKNKNTFLLETHSEHLILRILRRIRETTRNKLPDGVQPIRPEDVAVLYVQYGDDGSTVKELRVNEQGRFIDDWPNGFFEERFNEEF